MALLRFLKLKFFNGHERSLRTKKNVVALLAFNGINVVINLALIPLSISLVDNYRYGVWITIFNVLAMIQVFDIGIGNGLRNKLTTAISNDDFNAAKEYVSSAYSIMTVISFALVFFFLIPWFVIDWSFVFNVDRSLSSDLFLLIGVSFILTAFQFTLKLITTIYQAMHKTAIPALIFAISNTIILVIFIVYKSIFIGDIVIMGLIYTIVPTLVLLVTSLIVFNGKLINIKPNISSVNWKKSKELFSLGSQFFIIQIAILIIFQSDSLIIAHSISPDAVTPYNVVYKYFGIVSLIASFIMAPLWSAYTEAYVMKDFIWVKHVIYKQLKLFFVLGAVILVMIPLAKWILPFWVGSDMNFSFSLLIFMALFTIISIWNNIFALFLNGIGKTKLQMLTSTLGALINIPLSMYFAKIYGVGGVILASTMSLSLFAIFGFRETFKSLKNYERIG